MICKKCRAEIPDESRFCLRCGASQLPPPAHRPKARGNGTGTAYKRGRGWTARVVVGWKTVEGAPRPRPIWRTKSGFATKREALDYCRILLEQATGPARRVAPTLAAYWDTYAAGELAQLSRSKRVAYTGAWKKLSALHLRPVDGLTVADLREAVSSVASTHYTARDCRQVLSNLFALAGADGWVSKDLPSYIVLPRLEEREREAFTAEEQAALWRLYESGDMRAAIPLLMICTGMMPGEAQALRVEHIDLQARTIQGVGMKTDVRKKSPIYLPDDIMPVVEDLIAHAQPSGGIWARNTPAWYANYYGALEAAKCRRLEPYSCRHSTATRLAITEGIAPQTIQRIMRWSTTKMLDRYAHPDDAAVRAAADSITRI